jgi:hypothetical protein
MAGGSRMVEIGATDTRRTPEIIDHVCVTH